MAGQGLGWAAWVTGRPDSGGADALRPCRREPPSWWGVKGLCPCAGRSGGPAAELVCGSGRVGARRAHLSVPQQTCPGHQKSGLSRDRGVWSSQGSLTGSRGRDMPRVGVGGPWAWCPERVAVSRPRASWELSRGGGICRLAWGQLEAVAFPQALEGMPVPAWAPATCMALFPPRDGTTERGEEASAGISSPGSCAFLGS